MMDDENIPELTIEASEITDKTRKLRACWTPYTEDEKKLVLDAISMKELETTYFHHGYPDDQLVMGFFYWDGSDIIRVKAEYPDTMTPEEKEVVLDYMSNSTEETSYMGKSTSRIDGTFLGSRDMRSPDGKWIFPEQWDTHYVEKHDIAPTREFIEDALKWKECE
jgi:hypothetical protein